MTGRRALLGRRSAVAVEFALIAPLLLLLCLTVVEFAAAIRIHLAVNQAARVVAGLIVQQTDVTTAQLNDFYIAGKYCSSFTTGSVAMSATSVAFKAGAATGSVAWDAASVSADYAAAPANVLALSSGLAATSLGAIVGGDSVIVVQASATFTVPLPYGPIAASYTFTSTAFARPRKGFTVSLN